MKLAKIEKPKGLEKSSKEKFKKAMVDRFGANLKKKLGVLVDQKMWVQRQTDYNEVLGCALEGRQAWEDFKEEVDREDPECTP